jgi:hypothetical protein
MKHPIENSQNTLTRLMEKVRDDAARQADYIAPTHDLQKTTDANGVPQVVMEQRGGVPTTILDINDVAFAQIAGHAGIEVRTARRLQSDYPEQLDGLINAIWRKETSVRMLRSYEGLALTDGGRGKLRAFVSDKFKTFDNVNLLQSALPQLMESPAQFQVVNAIVTDKRLYLRLKSLIHTGEGAGVGDVMANGIGLQNSEVSMGSVSVYQIAWTLACLNGMQTQNKTRSSHITSGRNSDDWGKLSDEAKDADNRALELKIRDLVGVYSSRDSFDAVLENMKAAAADVIDADADKAALVDNLGTVMKLSKKETGDVLNGLLDTIGQAGYERDKPLSRATLINAVTAVSHKADADDVDLWQQRGGQLLNMSRPDWQRVAAAA